METEDLYQNDIFENEYEEGFEDGFMAGIEDVLENASSYADGDEESFKGLKDSKLFKKLNIGQGGGAAGRKQRRAERVAGKLQRGGSSKGETKAALEAARNLITQRQAQSQASQQVESAEPEKDNKTMYIIIGAVVLVAIGIGVYFYMKKKK